MKSLHNLFWDTIFLGIVYSLSESELRDAFAEFGDVVSVKILTDRETGRSRGFGFVEMENDDEARTAIERFHEYEFMGRPLTVNEARPRERRERRW